MNIIDGTYNVPLVLLSVAISMLGAFAALQVARQIDRSEAGARPFWTLLAGVTLGGGAIWSMHFIGMLALDLGVPVRYDLPLTVVSLLLAAGMTSVGFRVASSHRRQPSWCLLAGGLTGAGVVGMHYIGMMAMRLPATMSYDPWLVTASVVIAFLAASASIWLAFNPSRGLLGAAAAVVMGLAVSGMHYTGMAAVTFHVASADTGPPTALPADLLAFTVFLVAVLTIAIALTVVDTPARRLASRVRRMDWRGPLGVAVVLTAAVAVPIGAGWWARTTLDRVFKQRLAGELQTVLQADVAAIELWAARQRATADRIVDDDTVRAIVRQAVASGPGTAGWRLAVDQLNRHVAPLVRAQAFRGVRLFDQPEGEAASFVTRVRTGETVVSAPLMLPGEGGTFAVEMLAGAAVRDAGERIIGVVAFRMDPGDEFYRMLTVARSGESGETYAFSRDGTVLSPSRFASDLATLGLIPVGSSGALDLRAADPGGDLTRGFQPGDDRWPPTRAAAAAANGQPGVDVDGYRDYRGVPVVGAWTWLSDLGLAVVTEVDVAEAFAPVVELRRGLWALLALLSTAVVGLLIGHGIYRRQERQARRGQRLGQYTLEKKLGAGGMGVVYRARHAMLRRPTAVKLLLAGKASRRGIERFEREVQLTAQLTHPNTIAIYDYGRTPEGVFYYAMEYLSGRTLDALVEQHGAQPEGRVVHILRQACGSLAEAHEAGLVHRDVKPSNIMLCSRGGQPDVVKVLDFGLVKAVESSDPGLTAEGTVTGTPSYMSPEAITTPDAVDGRSDLYCLAAVGYYLLTGTHLFAARTAVEAVSHHLHTAPDPPSSRTAQPISPDVERLILQCLAKDPAERPASASELRDLLDACRSAPWSAAAAREWWAEARMAQVTPTSPTVTSDTEQRLAIDLQGREDLDSSGQPS